MLVNCESADASLKAACVAKMEPQIQSCSANAPAIMHDKAQYKSVAKAYWACVISHPFCRSVEVTSLENMRALCGKQT